MTPLPDRRLVHLREAIEHLQPLLPGPGCVGRKPYFSSGPATQATGTPGTDQRAEQARAEADGGDDVLLLRIELAHHAAEPALGADLVGLAGVPDVHRAEVRARRIEIADAVHDGELVVVPELLHRRQVVRDAVVLVEMR